MLFIVKFRKLFDYIPPYFRKEFFTNLQLDTNNYSKEKKQKYLGLIFPQKCLFYISQQLCIKHINNQKTTTKIEK